MSLDMRMVHSKDVYPYSYYHETHIAKKSGISQLANLVRTLERYVLCL